jgi:methanogenic corrinoid protein MtbC1
MLAHRTPYQCLAFPDLNDGKIATMDVEAFAKLVLLPDESLARAYVEAVCASRIPLAIIYVVLLGPTARYLGELWENDLCDFTEVSLGLGRLQRLVHEFSPAHGPSVGTIANGRSILLLPSPGDQHSFGLVMLGELFRCAGWDVSGGPAELSADPETLVHHAWYDIVGFSVGCEANVATVSEAIRTVRKASMNQRVGIMVGGPIFAVHPEYAKRFEADICTNDGRHAPVLAEKFVSNLEALSD